MNEYKAVNTADLVTLVEHAVEHKFNRIPLLDQVDVDPDGAHLLARVLYGHNMDAAGVPLHHRCRLLVKVRDVEDPAWAWIDVLEDDWQRLTDVNV